jgi:hypothetical protein
MASEFNPQYIFKSEENWGQQQRSYTTHNQCGQQSQQSPERSQQDSKNEGF